VIVGSLSHIPAWLVVGVVLQLCYCSDRRHTHSDGKQRHRTQDRRKVYYEV